MNTIFTCFTNPWLPFDSSEFTLQKLFADSQIPILIPHRIVRYQYRLLISSRYLIPPFFYELNPSERPFILPVPFLYVIRLLYPPIWNGFAIPSKVRPNRANFSSRSMIRSRILSSCLFNGHNFHPIDTQPRECVKWGERRAIASLPMALSVLLMWLKPDKWWESTGLRESGRETEKGKKSRRGRAYCVTV